MAVSTRALQRVVVMTAQMGYVVLPAALMKMAATCIALVCNCVCVSMHGAPPPWPYLGAGPV